MSEDGFRASGWARLRGYFLTGVIVAAPIGITVYLTWSFVGWVDGWVKPLIPHAYNPDSYLPFSVPGVGLFVAIGLITLLGFLAANLVGRAIVGFGERLLGRMPLVRNVYGALKQIFETVLRNRGQSFQRVGLIEYPRRGLWSPVFVAEAPKGELQRRIGGAGEDEIIAVFLMMTPNPTAGYLIYVPRRDVILLDMSVEEGAKLIVSAGLVEPPDLKAPAPVPAPPPGIDASLIPTAEAARRRRG